jgi:hypothetical protein
MTRRARVLAAAAAAAAMVDAAGAYGKAGKTDKHNCAIVKLVIVGVRTGRQHSKSAKGE